MEQEVVVRIPDDVHGQIAFLAEETGRSLNAEIVARLRASLDPPPAYEHELREELKLLRAEVRALRDLFNRAIE